MRASGLFGWAALAVVAPAPIAAAGLDEGDRAAIAALEQRVAPLPCGQGKAPAPLTERMAEVRVPAVSVAFIEDGRVKWARAYGVTVADGGRAATTDTSFQAASMTKPLTAAVALRLVDQGRLSLDEDVNARLRGWRVPMPAAPGEGTARVTLRRLLSHTAGLTVAGYPGYPAGAPLPSIVQSLNGEAPARTPAVRVYAAPGAGIGYSGGGYSVAQLLMSDATGIAFPALVRRIWLGPVGMTRSGFDRPRGAAGGHDEEGAPIPGGGHHYPELAAAGLWTTPSDYARFLIAVQRAWAGERGALLKPETARAMTAPVMADYGLGVTVMRRDGRVAITHGGSNEGFECRFVAFLDGSRQGLVVMTNGQGGRALAAGIQRTIGRAYGWPETLGPPPPRAPDA